MLSIMSPNLIRRPYRYKETRGMIISQTEEAVRAGISCLFENRKELEKYVKENPLFLHSFEPVQVEDGPRAAFLMAEASETACVGPMAAVAGVLADLAVEEMRHCNVEVAIVENGGEVAISSIEPVDIALQAGSTPLSKHMGFRIDRFPAGIATSSGVYSHAFSFGEAEAVTIFTQEAGLADAAATAVCNAVDGVDKELAVERGLERALEIEGVEGAFIIYRDIVGTGGRIPSIIGVKPAEEVGVKRCRAEGRIPV